MANKLKITLLLVAIVMVAALLISIPRFIRCCSFYKLTSESCRITSDTGQIVEFGYLKTLGQKPVIIEFPKVTPAPNFSIGYAQFYIDPNTIRTIRFAEPHMAIFIDCYDYHLGFLAPAVPAKMFNSRTKEAAKLPGKAAGLFKLMTEDLFEAHVKISSALPRTYFQIFFMSDDNYAEYSTLCLFKTMLIHNDNGIGIFRTNTTKGIVRFGAVDKPSQMLAEVFSKDACLSQDIVVTSKSPEKSKAALLSLLSTYTLLIDKVPEEPALRKAILDNLATHPNFAFNRPPGPSRPEGWN